MNFGDCERLFDAYLDDELTGSLRLEFDAHRLRCQRCQQNLAMIEAVGDVVASDRQVPAMSADFTDSVMQRVARPRRVVRLPRRVAIIAAVALQAAAVLLYAFVFRTPTGQTPPTGVDVVDSGRESIEAPRIVVMGPVHADYAEWDAVDLYEYIDDRVEVLRAAPVNWAADFRHLARAPLNITVGDEIARSSERFAVGSPWAVMMDALLSPPAAIEPEESEPATPAPANVYPL